MNFNDKRWLAIALACLWTAGAGAMTSDEHKTRADQIESSYKADRDKCDSLSGNAKDICVEQAKGRHKVAKAELDAQYKPSAKASYEVSEARADAAYSVAKEKCDDLSGNAKDVCVKDAKAAHTKAIEDAKVQRTSVDASKERAEAVSDARQDAAKKKTEADYAAAKERCDSLSGDAKDKCVGEAKTRYDMK